MNIELNGEPQTCAEGLTLAALIEQLALTGKRIAVEVNLEIISRSQFEQFRLAEGDRVEIVHAIGGG